MSAVPYESSKLCEAIQKEIKVSRHHQTNFYSNLVEREESEQRHSALSEASGNFSSQLKSKWNIKNKSQLSHPDICYSVAIVDWDCLAFQKQSKLVNNNISITATTTKLISFLRIVFPYLDTQVAALSTSRVVNLTRHRVSCSPSAATDSSREKLIGRSMKFPRSFTKSQIHLRSAIFKFLFRLSIFLVSHKRPQRRKRKSSQFVSGSRRDQFGGLHEKFFLRFGKQRL